MHFFPYRGETKSINSQVRDTAPGKFIRLSDGITHYEMAGVIKNSPVILVHGFSVPYYVWDPTFDALRNTGFNVLRYDLFGRGYSDRPKLKNDVNLFTKQLYGLIDNLSLSTPVNLVGLSLGGIIVACFTNQYPDLVDKIVLIDSAGHLINTPWYFRFLMAPIIGEIAFSLVGNGKLVEGIAADFFDQKEINVFLERYREQMQYRGFKRALLSTIRNGMLQDFTEEFKKIGHLGKDVLIIWGKEDKAVPYEHLDLFLKEIPNAEHLLIENSGHIPHYEHPEEANPKIISFLKG
ncbi:MAG TPA: alpha/beta hydrolase [Anaerolineae bacterium]|nr:alpha/beta hydrolase [Anaerolineae bacterium]